MNYGVSIHSKLRRFLQRSVRGFNLYIHHLYGCWNDRIRKNCLGTIITTTGSKRNRTVPGEDNLVLFAVATAYSELLNTLPNIEFVKGIPENLEQDSYFNDNIGNLIVIDDQMIEAGNDNRIVNLFTKGSHHRNPSVIYILQNLFHQGKDSRSISLNSHYLALFKNPRDKLQILTLAKQMYPKETDWFLKQYEEAVRRPFGYLFVDLKPNTEDSCRLRTNELSGNEKFDKGGIEANISQELLQYLKQQNLITPPVTPEMQRLHNNMDKLLHHTDLGE